MKGALDGRGQMLLRLFPRGNDLVVCFYVVAVLQFVVGGQPFVDLLCALRDGDGIRYAQAELR